MPGLLFCALTMFDKRTEWATLVATGSLQMVAFDF